MKQLHFYLVFVFFSSCSQTVDPWWYDEKNYIEQKRGENDGYPFVIIYVNKKNKNYTLKKNYLAASTYMSNSFMKTFYYKNIPNGPFISYVNGKKFIQGTYKMGKYDGERLSYTEGILTQRAHFNSGVKTGMWEKYDKKGNLIQTLTFDRKGNVIKKEYNEKGELTSTIMFDEQGGILENQDEK